MRVFFTFFVVVLLLVSSYMVSQDASQIPCDEGLIEIVKLSDNDVEKFCVTPSMVGSFKRLGWQVTERDTSLNVTEETTAIGTENTEEIPEIIEEAVTEEEVNEDTETIGARNFVIVPEQSKASYIVDEEFLGGALEKLEISPGPVTAVGTTQQVEGHLQLNSDNLTDPQALGSNSFTVNIESLTSDDDRRDDRIKEHNLESSIYPLATFTATTIEGAPAKYAQGEEISFQLLGDLTVREITIPATFDATVTLDGSTIEGKLSTDLKMTDFGFDPPDWAGIRTVENDFIVEVEFKMIEGQIPSMSEVAEIAEPTLTQNNSMSFFITSAGPGNGANLGGLSGADQHCQTLAESVGAGSLTWHAYLSTTASDNEPAVNARDRIGEGPWYNANQVLVAQSVDDLHSDLNNLSKEASVNEKGEIVNGRGDEPNRHDILTGSLLDGTASLSDEDSTCQNWTSDSEGSALVGHHDRTGGGDNPTSWNSAHGSRGCSQENLQSTGGDGLFYCFATAD